MYFLIASIKYQKHLVLLKICNKRLEKAVIRRIFAVKQPLQNRVPRVRSLLPLPKQQAPLLRCLLFFVCAKNENEALGECRGVRVSCGGLCIQSMQKHRPSRQARPSPSAPAIVVADYVSFATTFSLKSHRLAHAVAPPIPKKSLTFRGPHKFAAQPCGFEPFFFCCLSLAHGLFCRILIPKTCADFPSGGILLQRFRLLHHQ